MFKNNTLKQDFIILDSAKTAVNFKKTLLKQRKCFLGTDVLTLRDLFVEHIFSVCSSDKILINDIDAMKIMYGALYEIVNDNEEHVLYQCIAQPSYRTYVYDFVRNIKMCGADIDKISAVNNSQKWNSLIQMIKLYNKKLSEKHQIDHADKIKETIKILKQEKYNFNIDLKIYTLSVTTELEKQLLDELTQHTVNIEYIDSFEKLYNTENKPAVTVKAFPNNYTELEYIISDIISRNIPFDQTVIAVSDYNNAVNDIQKILKDHKISDVLSVEYSDGISISSTLSFELFCKLLDLFKTENIPAYMISLLYCNMYEIPKDENQKIISKNKLIKVIQNFSGYFTFEKMNIKIEQLKQQNIEIDDERYKLSDDALECISKIITYLQGFYEIITDEKRSINKKLKYCAEFLKKVSLTKKDQRERVAENAIIECIEQYIDDQLYFLNNTEIDLIIEDLKSSVSQITFKIEEDNNNAAVTIMSLQSLFGSFVPHVYALGLSTKNFPGKALQNPIFLDEEIHNVNNILAEDNIFIPTSVRKTEILYHNMEKLACACSEHLHVSYEFYHDGKLMPPSEMITKNTEKNTENEFASLQDFLVTINAQTDLKELIKDNYRQTPVNIFQNTQVLDDKSYFNNLNKQYKTINDVLYKRNYVNEITEYDGQISKENMNMFMKEKLTFSSSSLKQLLQCPFRYFISYILYACPLEIPEDWDKVTWLDPMNKGNVYHEILQTFFDDTRNSTLSLSEKRSTLQSITSRVLADHKSDTLIDEHIFTHESLIIQHQLEAILENEENNILGKECKNILNEAAFGYKQNRKGSRNILNEEFAKLILTEEIIIQLKGYIDRVDLNERDGRVLILDYKTGRDKLPENTSDWQNNGDFIQHLVYGIAFEKELEKYNVTEILSGYYFILADLKKQPKLSNYHHHIEKFKEILYQLFLTLQQDNTFYANVYSCNYCEYKELCKENQHNYTNKYTAEMCKNMEVISGEYKEVEHE